MGRGGGGAREREQQRECTWDKTTFQGVKYIYMYLVPETDTHISQPDENTISPSQQIYPGVIDEYDTDTGKDLREFSEVPFSRPMYRKVRKSHGTFGPIFD